MPAERPIRDGDGAGFGLIETLRFEDGVFVRLHRHLDRLASSAKELGFHHDRDRVRVALRQVDGPSPQRVRLVLTREGLVDVTTAPFMRLSRDTVWRLAVANTRLDSADLLLRHKTTRRALYERARAEFPSDAIDEVLLLNERGEICEGAITTLFADMGDGTLLTPPLSSGLLAGVLRAELLEEGRAQEGLLTPALLSDAKALYVGNSLRGMIRARLA